jgi:hypothetical protein
MISKSSRVALWPTKPEISTVASCRAGLGNTVISWSSFAYIFGAMQEKGTDRDGS